MGIPHSIKTDNASAYTSQKLKSFFSQWQITHITGIPYNSQGQAIIGRSNRTLKDVLLKQKRGIETPRVRILRALYTLNFLNIAEDGLIAAQRHLDHNINKDKPLL
jgi:transposase InsO family protein